MRSIRRDPAEHELPTDSVVPDLLRRDLLGLEEGRERLISPVARSVGARRFDGVPNLPLGW